METRITTRDYSNDFSEDSFWRKLAKYAVVAGKQMVEKALVLFEALKDRDTPAWAKGVIVAALGYFVSPIDAMPDFVPFAGYADDLGAVAAAIGVVAAHIKQEHIAAAKATLRRWFGDAGSASNEFNGSSDQTPQSG
jgi:uncharacterized membrane protein YkvA (DUF1232 family)